MTEVSFRSGLHRMDNWPKSRVNAREHDFAILLKHHDAAERAEQTENEHSYDAIVERFERSSDGRVDTIKVGGLPTSASQLSSDALGEHDFSAAMAVASRSVAGFSGLLWPAPFPLGKGQGADAPAGVSNELADEHAWPDGMIVTDFLDLYHLSPGSG